MSKSGDFKLIINDANSADILNILRLFQASGWDINDHGHICYLPLGDEDFDWQIVPASEKETVLSILREKSSKSEIIGINLVSENTNIGLVTLFYPALTKISLSAEINRKMIDGMDITDFSWYLKEFIPIFLKAGMSIESIECIDS